MSNGNKTQNRPQARDDSAVAIENSFALIDVLANDRGSASQIWSLDQNDPSNNNTDLTFLPSGSQVLVRHDLVVYKVGQSFDYLGLGDTATDSFTYSIRMGDGTYSTATVDVLIHGTNDPAVIERESVTLVEGDSADDLSTSGTVAIDDVDSPDTFHAETQQGYYGSFTIEENGDWTYTSYSAHDEFEDGVEYGEVFAIWSSDMTMGTVSVNFIGTAESPAMLNAFAAPDLVALA